MNMREYTEFNKEKLDKSELCSGILFWICLGGLITGACLRGCQEIKKDSDKVKTPSIQMMKAAQNSR